MNESWQENLQPYQPKPGDRTPYPLSIDCHGKIQIDHNWFPVGSGYYVGNAGQMLTYMWQHLVPRFDQELEVGEKRPYNATNITECERSADIVKRPRQKYIN